MRSFEQSFAIHRASKQAYIARRQWPLHRIRTLQRSRGWKISFDHTPPPTYTPHTYTRAGVVWPETVPRTSARAARARVPAHIKEIRRGRASAPDSRKAFIRARADFRARIFFFFFCCAAGHDR